MWQNWREKGVLPATTNNYKHLVSLILFFFFFVQSNLCMMYHFRSMNRWLNIAFL